MIKHYAPLIVALLIIVVFSMVGCVSAPRPQIFIIEPPVVEHPFMGMTKPDTSNKVASNKVASNKVKYEIKDSFEVKDDPSKPKPIITAGIGFTQSW